MVFDMPRAPRSGRSAIASGSNPTSPSPASPSPRNHTKPTHQDEDFHRQAEAAAMAEIKRATFGSGLHSAGIQIKDQDKSKWFYTRVLGMDIVKETESGSATMIWLSFPNPADPEQPNLEFGQRRGLLQLVHVAGSESDTGFRVVHGIPGFCHFCINVADLEQSMARYKTMGVNIVEEGDNEQGWGVISDPDGYTIQLLHCNIDQSLALKRQVEEMMSIASSSASAIGRGRSSSSNGRSGSDSFGRRSLSPSATRTNGGGGGDAGSSVISSGLPALASFRGGSPDFEHPHWQREQQQQQRDHHGSSSSFRSHHNDEEHGGPLAPTTSTTDASDDEGDRLMPGPRSRRPSHAYSVHRGETSTSSNSNLSASSSSASINGKTPRPRYSAGHANANGTGRRPSAALSISSGSVSAPLSSSAENIMARSRSGSIFRPNAPKSIDLRALQLEAQQSFSPATAATIVAEAASANSVTMTSDGATVDVSSLPTSPADAGAGAIPMAAATLTAPAKNRPSTATGAGGANHKRRGGGGKTSSSLPSSSIDMSMNGGGKATAASPAPAPTSRQGAKSKAHSGLRSFRDRFSFGGGAA